MVSMMSLPPDFFKPSPALLRIEQSFPSKWLWETCLKALDRDTWDFDYSEKKREQILGALSSNLGPTQSALRRLYHLRSPLPRFVP